MSGAIGLVKEVTFGTGLVPTTLIPGTLDIPADTPSLRDETPYGGRLMPTSDRGRESISGTISGIDIRPDYIGHIFRGSLDAPTTTGAGPYQHVFKRRSSDVATGQALLSYSVTVDKSARRVRYNGSQFTGWTIDFDSENRVKMSSLEVTAKSMTWDVASFSLSPSTLRAFTFAHVAHTVDAVALTKVSTGSITFSNEMISVPLQDGTTGQSYFALGAQPVCTVNLDLFGGDTTLRDAWRNNTTVALILKWNAGASAILEISIPKFHIDSYNDPLDGFDESAASLTGTAEYDSGIAAEFAVTLTNSVTSY